MKLSKEGCHHFNVTFSVRSKCSCHDSDALLPYRNVVVMVVESLKEVEVVRDSVSGGCCKGSG